MVGFDIQGVMHDIIKPHVNRGVGYVAKPYSIKELLKSVLIYYNLMMRNPETYHFISRECVNLAKRYPISLMAMKLTNIFTSLMK